ncbi:hypothetical protein TRVA0_011S03004 [Trichomonascus vanleenenianus]|uniref:Pal1 family protein n=1 Tax=Trichomonascus vanleenenianus TaxID=2268995 RepID=UPI003ECBA598
MSMTRTQPPVQRRPDANVAFSSNNPFRASTTSSIYFSPFDEDDSVFGEKLDPPPTRQVPIRSQSAGSEMRPFSYMPTDDRPTSTYSMVSSAPSNRSRNTLLIDDSDNNTIDNQAAAIRRPYNPNRNTVYRKSTNPFLEDMAPESPPRQQQAPRRPPASSKPLVSLENKRPPPPPPTRQRRANSDSSVMEQPKTEDQRDQERREKDRERRHRHRDGTKKRSSKKKVHTDTIDKLDVTGFFGAGSFHHDGPFDACNPNRNKNTKRAPVKAFPVDGANMTLNGGLDTRDKYATENNILGRGVDEAYNDFNHGGRTPAKQNGTVTTFDTSLRNQPVHGDLTWGLGSTTFLDGTPASRDAVKLAEKEAQTAQLGRKKSIVQKLRGGNGPGPAVPRRMNSDNTTSQIERTNSNPSVDAPEPSAGGGLLRRVKSLKVSGRRRNS